jgi:hypothetical protein
MKQMPWMSTCERLLFFFLYKIRALLKTYYEAHDVMYYLCNIFLFYKCLYIAPLTEHHDVSDAGFDESGEALL